MFPILERNFIPIQWSEDNASVYGYLLGSIPTKVYKINIATGEKTLIQELQPQTSIGVVFVAPVVMTRDASRFAFSYCQVSSVLYIISGLH